MASLCISFPQLREGPGAFVYISAFDYILYNVLTSVTFLFILYLYIDEIE